MVDWNAVYAGVKARIEACGVQVRAERLGFETTGTFDGLTITTNTDYDLETRCHNIVHSFGHIAQWCRELRRFQALYEALYAAKANKATDPAALERALAHFREYEEEASEFGVWLLEETGHAAAVPAFTHFARADIEAIVGFHRDGLAPIWHEFYASWTRRVTAGELPLAPFAPKPIPPFKPILIAVQEVIQEVDGKVGI